MLRQIFAGQCHGAGLQGFHKCSDRWEFKHKHFRRGCITELTRITRRKGFGISTSRRTAEDGAACAPRPSSMPHLTSTPSEGPTRSFQPSNLGMPLFRPTQVPAAVGSRGLEQLGIAADTLLKAEEDRILETRAPLRTHHEPPIHYGMPSLGEAQLGNAHMPFDGGCTRGDKGRVSDGDLQDELGRQGQMIRELVAEVGRLKEEQGSMTMQILMMEDSQKASKKQRTEFSPNLARLDPRASSAAAPASELSTNQRLGACENGLETVDKNVMTLHHEMKIFEADMKAESDSLSSRICSSIMRVAGPGTELEGAMKRFLSDVQSPPSQRKPVSYVANSTVQTTQGLPAVARQSTEGGQFWSAMYDFGRGRQPCRDASGMAGASSARVPQPQS